MMIDCQKVRIETGRKKSIWRPFVLKPEVVISRQWTEVSGLHLVC